MVSVLYTKLGKRSISYCAQLEIVASQPRIAALQGRPAAKPEAGCRGGCIAQVSQSGYLFVSKHINLAADALMECGGDLGPIHDLG